VASFRPAILNLNNKKTKKGVKANIQAMLIPEKERVYETKEMIKQIEIYNQHIRFTDDNE